MENRISAESFTAIYDSGCQGLAFDRSAFDSAVFWDRVDFDKILSRKGAARVIAELSPQRLYYSLIEKGPAECLEVLPLITREQFQRILDYDVWKRDELVPQRVLYWVDLLRQVDPEKAYQQFCDIEEEYQLATLSPYLRIYAPDDYEKMTDADQDRLYRLPGDAFYYSIETEDEETRNGVAGLLDCVMSSDMNYMINLIAYSAFIPKNESAHMASQFRKARLEEDGFVSYEESLSCFAAIQEKEPWASFEKSEETAVATLPRHHSHFLDDVLYYGKEKVWDQEQLASINQTLAHLANTLCTASQIEVDDISSLKFIFSNAKALCSLGLEYVSSGDVKMGAQVLSAHYPKEMFKTGLGLLLSCQKKIVDTMVELQIPEQEKFKKYFVNKNYALFLDSVDKYLLNDLGFEVCEIVKALFNRYPQYPKEVLFYVCAPARVRWHIGTFGFPILRAKVR